VLKRFGVIFALFVGLLLVACASSNQGGLVIQDVWGRPSPGSASNSAFYMTIRNTGQEQDALIQASADVCGRTELHRSSIDEEGVMSMQQVQQIDVPAGDLTALEPGGLHIMCLDRLSELNSGDRVPITLSFTRTGEIIVEAEIKEQ